MIANMVLNNVATDAALIRTLNSREELSYEISTGHFNTDLKGQALADFYHEVKRAFIAGSLKVTKPIGYKISSVHGVSDNPVTQRNPAVCENPPEIAKNIEKLIFVGEHPIEFKSVEKSGALTTSNIQFVANPIEVKMLTHDDYLLKALIPVSIDVVVNTDMGYSTMEQNSAKLQNIDMVNASEYFPLNADYSLVNIVHLLPFFGNAIFFRLEQNVNTELLFKLWDDFMKERES